MPRRDDIQKILVIGSGPIVIGQAAEFDYSGAQACKVLLEEGYEVVLVNSNPATIMTDPEFATATYIEPLLPGPVARVIERERPDALLPTLGGGTALNLARQLTEDGTLERYDVELIGADYEAIQRAEDRDLFRMTMERAGLRVPRSAVVSSMSEAERCLPDLGLPAIVRPGFTMGGEGGGIAYTETEYRERIAEGLAASPIGQVLVDESVIGWGEFELEVMRDRNDNVVVVCSIENVDPMGVHTGDSVTVAPQQTLSDRQYQALRDQAIAVIRAVGVETGGSNIQFAVNPETEEIVVIEMNPRVSRSSALASKATGFPIAKIAARLAVGYALEEIDNDITRVTPASFEPTIDYVVVKWPRFAFEKFPGADGSLSTYMQSVGEAMAIGRTFKQAFVKAMRSRELDVTPPPPDDTDELLRSLETPAHDRYELLFEAVRRGVGEAPAVRADGDRPLVHGRDRRAGTRRGPGGRPGPDVQGGGHLRGGVRGRHALLLLRLGAAWPGWAAARGAARRPCQRRDPWLWPQPDRAGHRVRLLLRARGHDGPSVGPRRGDGQLQPRDRLHRLRHQRPAVLRAAHARGRARGDRAGAPGGGDRAVRWPDSAQARPRPRGRRRAPARDAGRVDPPGRGQAELRRDPGRAWAQGPAICHRHVGSGGAGGRRDRSAFPCSCGPPTCSGGRAMEICYSDDGLRGYLDRTHGPAGPSGTIFLDRFLENAIEIDVDALCDGETVQIGAIMQHVEEAGVHSGDSACVIPTMSLGPEMLRQVEEATERIALRLGTVGLINIQFAVFGDEELFVIEANPRASRTVPFVSKAIGVPLAKVACRLMLGERLGDLDLGLPATPGHVSVKEAVLPFGRFPRADALLGPEMKSTGEVMGVAADYPTAFGKAQAAAGAQLPTGGTVFISVTDGDKPTATQLAASLHDLGFAVLATGGTAQAIRRMGVPVERISKVSEGSPNVVDRIDAGGVDLVINTPTGSGARADGYEIRRAAVARGIPCITTLSGASAAQRAIRALRAEEAEVVPLQELHAPGREAAPRVEAE